MQWSKSKNYIDRIEYSITDQCNLNCAYCCHYAPVAELFYVDVKTFKFDIKRLSVLTSKGKFLGTLGILGGEPLLHPSFIEICIIARKELPYSRIRVTTNGLLLNKLSKQDLCILRRYDIEILISKYRIEDNFDAMKSLLDEYHIVNKFCNKNELVDFYKYSLDESGSQNMKEAHDKCTLWQSEPFYTCHELRNGQLYPCSQIARIDTLNKKFGTKMPDKKLSSIDIHKNELSQICDFLKRPVVHCKYCKTFEWNNTIQGKWKLSKKCKEEFV